MNSAADPFAYHLSLRESLASARNPHADQPLDRLSLLRNVGYCQLGNIDWHDLHAELRLVLGNTASGELVAEIRHELGQLRDALASWQLNVDDDDFIARDEAAELLLTRMDLWAACEGWQAWCAESNSPMDTNQQLNLELQAIDSQLRQPAIAEWLAPVCTLPLLDNLRGMIGPEFSGTLPWWLGEELPQRWQEQVALQNWLEEFVRAQAGRRYYHFPRFRAQTIVEPDEAARNRALWQVRWIRSSPLDGRITSQTLPNDQILIEVDNPAAEVTALCLAEVSPSLQRSATWSIPALTPVELPSRSTDQATAAETYYELSASTGEVPNEASQRPLKFLCGNEWCDVLTNLGMPDSDWRTLLVFQIAVRQARSCVLELTSGKERYLEPIKLTPPNVAFPEFAQFTLEVPSSDIPFSYQQGFQVTIRDLTSADFELPDLAAELHKAGLTAADVQVIDAIPREEPEPDPHPTTPARISRFVVDRQRWQQLTSANPAAECYLQVDCGPAATPQHWTAEQQAARGLWFSFYARFFAIVYKAIFSVMKNRDDVDELVQKFFLKKTRRLVKRLPEIQNQSAWLNTIARNFAIDAYRRQQLEVERLRIADDPDAIQQASFPDCDLDYPHLHDHLAQCIQGLLPDQQQLLGWRRAGKRAAEIASELGLSVKAVSERLQRLKRKLAGLLAKPVLQQCTQLQQFVLERWYRGDFIPAITEELNREPQFGNHTEEQVKAIRDQACLQVRRYLLRYAPDASR